jgi:hypothetical protein
MKATNGYVSYRVTDKPDEAQVTVRFDPATNDGYTTTHFRNSYIVSADVAVGVKRGSSPDIACIAAHEFGHALGLDGHSDVRSDLMYPIHQECTLWLPA